MLPFKAGAFQFTVPSSLFFQGKLACFQHWGVFEMLVICAFVKRFWTSSYKFTRLGRRHKHPILVHRKGRMRAIDVSSSTFLLPGFGPWGCIKWQELASNVKITVVAIIEVLHIFTSTTHAFENWQQRETWTILQNHAIDGREVYPIVVGGKGSKGVITV